MNRHNPFVGLRPYERSDSLFYFGRKEQTKTLLGQLHQHRFVAVVGSSGSGKSSLIRAGLIPQLEAGFLVQDRDQWQVATLKPGEAPLAHLAWALLGEHNTLTPTPLPEGEGLNATSTINDFLTAIRERGVQAVTEQLARRLNDSETNLFILVDQFEELFRFALDKDKAEQRQEAEEFVALLLSLSRSELPIYVCLTMRSDFLGDCDAFYGLPEAINRSQFLVPRLTRSQRQEVITHPVRLMQADIAPRLVDKLLNENIDTRDDLPVLQHVLMRMWDYWQENGGGGALDITHYEAVHTIHNALNHHADEALKVFGALDTKTEDLNKQQRIAKILFQALTTVDAGNRRIRRPAHLKEIAKIAGVNPEDVIEVINQFREQGRSFLVLSSENPDDNPLIDISHESLIRQWNTLNQWVDEEAAAAKTYRRLLETETLHHRNRAELYSGVELQQALKWKDALPAGHAGFVWAQRYNPRLDAALAFIDTSQQAEQARIEQEEAQQKEQERLLREKAALEEKQRQMAEQQIKEQRKALTRTRWLSGLMAVLMLFMFAAAWFAKQSADDAYQAKQATEQALITARQNEEKAEMHAQEARDKELTANYNLAKVFEEKALPLISDEVLAGDASAINPYQLKQAWLYGLEAAAQQVPDNKTAVLPATLGRLSALRTQDLSSERKQTPSLNIGAIQSIAISPDGKWTASGSSDNTVRLWDAQSGETLKTLQGHNADINSVAFSPDGKWIASGSDDNTVRLWDAQSGETLKTLQGHTRAVISVAFSPDGKWIASGSDDNTVRLWDAQSGETLKTLQGHTHWVRSVAFSPDGKWIASGSDDNTVRLWDAQSGETLKTLQGHTHWVRSVAFSPDGKWIASGSSDNTVRLWDAQSGETLKTLQGHTHWVRSVAFSPDGKWIASGSDDNTVRLWDAQSGETLKTLQGHTSTVWSVAFSPDGKWIASGSDDNTVRLWDAQSGETLKTLQGHTHWVRSVAFSPDGKWIASGSDDNTVRLWDAQSGETLKTLQGHTHWVRSVAFSPDGKWIASGSSDNTVRLWDAQSGETLKTLQGHTHWVRSVAFSPDGKWIASGSDDNTVRLWDAQSGETLKTLQGHTRAVISVAFSPDGKWIASGSSDNTVRLWDAQSGETLKTLQGHTHWVRSVAFSPDGKWIASGSSDNTVRLWDAQSGETLKTLQGHTSTVWSVAFSPDGKWIASGSSDNTVRLWDAQSGETLKTLQGHNADINSVAFSPDGKWIASGSSDNTVRLWDFTHPTHRLAYDFAPVAVSGALKFIWQMDRDELHIRRKAPPPALLPQMGYHITWTDETRKYRPLLDMPRPDETKLDQVVRWLEERCAYKHPERYNCTPVED